MRSLDFSSWQAIVSTILGLSLITLVGVGVRLLAMYTIQQRRERENRQINERLRTLIAAYKTLGGSFTGNLAVDPSHLRDQRRSVSEAEAAEPIGAGSSDRSRRIRDAVETALSDIILLGTDEHVRLAAHAAQELVAGRPVHTGALVASLRDFIRSALALAPIPDGVTIPAQGPTRPAGTGGRGKGEMGRDDTRTGGKTGGGVGGAGMGGGMGGVGMGLGTSGADPDDPSHPQR